MKKSIDTNLQGIETREVNMMITTSGGNASPTAKNYRLSIPSAWAQTLGITSDDRALTISFDGEQIVIKKSNKQDK